MTSDRSKKFIEDNRWLLAKQFRDRADQAANIIRGLLFTAATGAIAFILHYCLGKREAS